MNKTKNFILPFFLLSTLLIFTSCEDDESNSPEKYFKLKNSRITIASNLRSVYGDAIYDFPSFNSIESVIKFEITDEEILDLTYDQDNIRGFMEIGIDRFNSTMVIPGNQDVFIEYTGSIRDNIIRFVVNSEAIKYYDGEDYIYKSYDTFDEGCAINHDQVHTDSYFDIPASGHFYFNYRVD